MDLFSHQWPPLSRLHHCISLYPPPLTSHGTELLTRVFRVLLRGLLCMYFMSVFPLYLISMGVSSRFYKDMAEITFFLFVGRSRTTSIGTDPNSQNSKIFHWNRSKAYSILFYSLILAQAMALSYIPYVGRAFSFSQYALIGAYYCFEHYWSLLEVSLEKRMEMAQTRWPYFLGFGSPLTITTFLRRFCPFIPNGEYCQSFDD